VVKIILHKRTIALGTSIDFRKDLRRSASRGDSGGSGWRKEAVKTGGRIHNITEKRRERSSLRAPADLESSSYFIALSTPELID